jgi:XTP/dITP diphosphohydrolase
MANLAKLLRNLRGVPTERRTARFRCVIVVAHPAGGRLVVERTCEGLIADEPRGAGGFGYDPIFIEPSSGRTFAELGPEEKHRCSHRGRACSALRSQLIPFLDSTAGSSLNRRAGSVNRRWSREPAPRG